MTVVLEKEGNRKKKEGKEGGDRAGEGGDRAGEVSMVEEEEDMGHQEQDIMVLSPGNHRTVVPSTSRKFSNPHVVTMKLSAETQMLPGCEGF